jgi:hypothetical protein
VFVLIDPGIREPSLTQPWNTGLSPAATAWFPNQAAVSATVAPTASAARLPFFDLTSIRPSQSWHGGRTMRPPG